MLVWSHELGSFKEFGHNRTFALKEEACSKEQFCFMVFDLIQLDNMDLTSKPLSMRRGYLEKILIPRKHTIELVQSIPIKTESEVYERLDQAILNREEGIMIKNMDSPYVPGERKLNWLKLKPDHLDGLGETMDLIILGGYFGTKFNKKSISHFLLGVADRPKEEGKHPELFHSFCKVGSGYTASELSALQNSLQPYWKRYKRGEQIPFFAGWQPQANEIPDMYIEPKK